MKAVERIYVDHACIEFLCAKRIDFVVHKVLIACSLQYKNIKQFKPQSLYQIAIYLPFPNNRLLYFAQLEVSKNSNSAEIKFNKPSALYRCLGLHTTEACKIFSSIELILGTISFQDF